MTDIIGAFTSESKADSKYSQVSVYEQTIQAGDRVIAIANIAYLDIGEYDLSSGKKGSLRTLAVFAGIAAIIAGVGGQNTPLAIILLVVALALLIRSFMYSSDFIFTIITCDGTRTSFIGKNRQLMFDARNFVAQKINSSDKISRNIFNFNNNTISGSQIGNIENR